MKTKVGCRDSSLRFKKTNHKSFTICRMNKTWEIKFVRFSQRIMNAETKIQRKGKKEEDKPTVQEIRGGEKEK